VCRPVVLCFCRCCRLRLGPLGGVAGQPIASAVSPHRSEHNELDRRAAAYLRNRPSPSQGRPCEGAAF
jgi:hypothetical protein